MAGRGTEILRGLIGPIGSPEFQVPGPQFPAVCQPVASGRPRDEIVASGPVI